MFEVGARASTFRDGGTPRLRDFLCASTGKDQGAPPPGPPPCWGLGAALSPLDAARGRGLRIRVRRTPALPVRRAGSRWLRAPPRATRSAPMA